MGNLIGITLNVQIILYIVILPINMTYLSIYLVLFFAIS